MMVARDLAPSQLDSILGRTSPVLKLAISIVWLIGLATTTALVPPLLLATVAVAVDGRGAVDGLLGGRTWSRAVG